MKLAMLGLGAISPYFLRAIEADPALELTGVCDLDADKLAPFADRGTACFTDFTELLDAGTAEAVVVTLPNDVHAPAVLAALERGVHVCCEKPLAIASADADAMETAARRAGATLFTAFHRRYNTNLRTLAQHLPRDRQDIVRVTARYHENIAEHTGGEQWYLDPARCGGGCLIDNGPNALDAVRHLVGPLALRDATLGDVRSGAEFYAKLSLDAGGVPVEVELDWALDTGEIKDVVVELGDGRTLAADMLAGFDGFKASLDHEYTGILAQFRRAVAAGPHWHDPGPALVRLVEEAYAVGRAKELRLRMTAKEPVSARVVKLLFHSRDDRGMRLSPWASRCVAAGEVHELVTTVDRPRSPGDEVNRVGFLGFAEFTAATVVQRGDEVLAGDRYLGTVSGFDECHAPNHYNILIDTDRVLGAADIDLRVGDHIHFTEGPQ
ncbi:Gfo/Idh/MocA family protein [Streptomyces sp. NPDC059063]|uniref:Gfo/Idh/MocA family protein n=1 Tax=unclassified Streptomyces TaxID=2593676 RepID=UPI0036CA4B15